MSFLTSAPIHLTYAGGLYDRTAPLATGEVRPEGIELNYIPVVPPEAFWRQLQHSEFDVSELSYGFHNNRRDLDMLKRHLQEQNLLEHDFALEEAFAPSTLETFRQ